MQGPPLPPATRDPRPPARPPPSRLGAELASRALRGIPSGGGPRRSRCIGGEGGAPGRGSPPTRPDPRPLSGTVWSGRARLGALDPVTSNPRGSGAREGSGPGLRQPPGCPSPGKRDAPASGKWPLRRGAESAPRPPPGALNLESGGRLLLAPRRGSPGPALTQREPRPQADPGPAAARSGTQPGGVTRSRRSAPGGRASVPALEGSGVWSAGVCGIRTSEVRLGAPKLPNGSARASGDASAGLCG